MSEIFSEGEHYWKAFKWLILSSHWKSYGSKIALDDLTVSFHKGQITGLLGPNGAGKSTLLKAIVGLVKPQFGIIRIFDQPAHWRLNSEIAYLTDRPKWYKFHTIKQALTYALNVFPGFDLQRVPC